jgi:hypothetical protein
VSRPKLPRKVVLSVKGPTITCLLALNCKLFLRTSVLVVDKILNSKAAATKALTIAAEKSFVKEVATTKAVTDTTAVKASRHVTTSTALDVNTTSCFSSAAFIDATTVVATAETTHQGLLPRHLTAATGADLTTVTVSDSMQATALSLHAGTSMSGAPMIFGNTKICGDEVVIGKVVANRIAAVAPIVSCGVTVTCFFDRGRLQHTRNNAFDASQYLAAANIDATSSSAAFLLASMAFGAFVACKAPAAGFVHLHAISTSSLPMIHSDFHLGR